ncbi:MAG: MiaB/RimO family radical SAM methylthiotransferase, partial [Actinomycetota bacterium]
MAEQSAALGLLPPGPDEEPDAVVINSCAVTRESTASSRQLVRQEMRAHPEAVIVLTGCYPEAEPAESAALSGVEIVVVNESKERIPFILAKRLGAHPLAWQGGIALRTRVGVRAQTGCDERCAFCIVPQTRGPLSSRLMEDVVAEVSRRAAAGTREVVLTGVHLGKYGVDRGRSDDLARLVEAVVEVPGLARVRLSSILPSQLSPALLSLLRRHPKVASHVHLPLQSGSEAVLARMRRPYSAEEFARVAEQATAVVGLGLTTDVMVGFPGESPEEHRESLAFVERTGFSKLHVFRFSARPGTPAAAMAGQVTDRIKRARSREMIALGEELRADFLKAQVGRRLDVMVERVLPERAWGTSENFVRVEFSSPAGAVRVG